jgi:hypothetical protein
MEATGEGVHFLPDEHYKTWPGQLPEEDIAAGIFLRSLTPREELAEFLATRSYCLQYNHHLREALDAMSLASQLAPHNRYFSESRDALLVHWQALRRAQAYVYAPSPLDGDVIPRSPHWVPGPDGQEWLIQVINRGQYHAPPLPFDVRCVCLHRSIVQLPNGGCAEVDVPLVGSGRPMEAHWVNLPYGELALVHKPMPWGTAISAGRGQIDTSQQNGHPVLPPRFSVAEDSWQDRGWLANVCQELRRQQLAASGMLEMPAMSPFALPPGPAPRWHTLKTVGDGLMFL